MAKKTAVKKRRWELFRGVGFAPDDGKFPERAPAMHYVVLMQSMHSGTSVFGPFLTAAAAHEWIRTEGESELFMRFDQCSVPGVSFHVDWLMVPTTREDE